MRTLLVTGFGPFGLVTANPSEAIVCGLAARWADGGRCRLVTAVLPVDFDAASATLCDLIRRERPDACVLLGVADGAAIRLERVARNRDASETPDMAGELRAGTPIVTDGPPTYASTLPLADIGRALDRQGLPWSFSDDAGGYLCNHAFYLARHESARQPSLRLCGLVHVPLPEAVPTPAGNDVGAALQRAIERVLAAIVDHR